MIELELMLCNFVLRIGFDIMFKSEFQIKKMDCPSEESMIRMKLSEVIKVKSLHFDINNRKLDVFHEGDVSPIAQLISELNLDSNLIATNEVDDNIVESQSNESKSLWIVLVINFLFFVLEMIFGWISNSMGLVADSLDMLADSIVYGLSLIAVGGTGALKKRIATMAGYFQLTLAILGFAEVIRRFIASDVLPNHQTMMVVSIFALLANVLCLFILQKTKSQEAHMQASMIFTSNDIIINSGVIIAGVLVLLLNSDFPDLIIGSIVFILVLQGARRILKLGN